MDTTVSAMLKATGHDLEWAVRFAGSSTPELKGVHMELIENVHYTRTGWREGEVATPDNRPQVAVILDAWNAAPDKRAFNDAHRVLADDAYLAWDAQISPEVKAQHAARAEAERAAEAKAFYAALPPGSNRSFWD
jgi:hypothetical protein